MSDVDEVTGILDRSLEVFDGPPSLRDQFSVEAKYAQRLESVMEDVRVALAANNEDDFCRAVASASFSLERVRAEILSDGLKARVTYETTKVPL